MSQVAIRPTRSMLLDGRHCEAGQVVVVDAAAANMAMQRGWAVGADMPEAPKPTSKTKAPARARSKSRDD